VLLGPAGLALALALAGVGAIVSVYGWMTGATLAIGFCVWLLTTRAFEQQWILLALIAAGLPFYLFSRRKSSLSGSV
jgi:FtsH-binding integral membrane protein